MQLIVDCFFFVEGIHYIVYIFENLSICCIMGKCISKLSAKEDCRTKFH